MPIAWPPPASGPGVPDRGGAVPQPRVYAQGDPYLALPMQVPGDGGEYGDGSRWTPTSGPPAGWNGAPARRLLVNLPGVDRPAAGSFVNHRAVLAVTQPPSLAGRPEQRPGAPSPRQWTPIDYAGYLPPPGVPMLPPPVPAPRARRAACQSREPEVAPSRSSFASDRRHLPRRLVEPPSPIVPGPYQFRVAPPPPMPPPPPIPWVWLAVTMEAFASAWSSLAGEGSPLRLFPLCSYPPSRRPAGLGFGSWPFAPPVECAGLWRGISLLREKMIAAK